MPIYKYKVKFPCGLEYDFSGEGWLLTGRVNDKDIVCPLHGKNCPPKKKRR